MSDEKGRATSDSLILRSQSKMLISVAEIADTIENFVMTREGTLASVKGPAPLVYDPVEKTLPSAYSRFMYGIYHTTLKGGAVDILLLHSGSSIYVYRGWNTTSPWLKVVGPTGGLVTMDLAVSRETPGFPTQFETTPKGVVIVPQNEDRAVFYNGEVAVPLGFDSVPSAPLGHGPETHEPDDDAKVNAQGYAVSRMTGGYTLHEDFGYGRLGTIKSAVASDAGARLLPGSYQCSYQWINYFGDLSPQSPRSNEILLHEQAVEADGGDSTADPQRVLKHVLWSNISTGPQGTVGRLVSRTKDMINKGTSQLYIVPGNVGYGIFGSFATLPDNSTTKLPDNVPDGWIVSTPHEVIPVPIFKLCKLALGRLWIANTTDDPGILIPSMPGTYGTFLSGTEIFPDPSGGEVTGLWSTSAGMLVFTVTSTFILTPSDDGQDFRVATLNPNIGCVAPSSLCSLPGGMTIWLGREGFYMFDGTNIVSISVEVQSETDRINPVRAKESVAIYDPNSNEYRCWVPFDGSRINNHCFIFDPQGWRSRTKEKLQSVCVTKDHRKYVIGAGGLKNSGQRGVWVLDRKDPNFGVGSVPTVLETTWITWERSKQKKTVKSIYLALRESYTGAVTVKVYRDWRKKSTAEYTDTTSGALYLEEDSPPTWGTSSWDSFDWGKNRPFWKRIDVSVPSCEVYKIKIETSHPIEFIGMSIDEEPKLGGIGTRIS